MEKVQQIEVAWMYNTVPVKVEEEEDEVDVEATFSDCSIRLRKTYSNKQTQSETVSTPLSHQPRSQGNVYLIWCSSFGRVVPVLISFRFLLVEMCIKVILGARCMCVCVRASITMGVWKL